MESSSKSSTYFGRFALGRPARGVANGSSSLSLTITKLVAVSCIARRFNARVDLVEMEVAVEAASSSSQERLERFPRTAIALNLVEAVTVEVISEGGREL
jgi:hypothetical protein